MKTHISKRCNVYELIRNYKGLLGENRNDELVAEFKYKTTKHVLMTWIQKTEKHAYFQRSEIIYHCCGFLSYAELQGRQW